MLLPFLWGNYCLSPPFFDVGLFSPFWFPFLYSSKNEQNTVALFIGQSADGVCSEFRGQDSFVVHRKPFPKLGVLLPPKHKEKFKSKELYQIRIEQIFPYWAISHRILFMINCIVKLASLPHLLTFLCYA